MFKKDKKELPLYQKSLADLEKARPFIEILQKAYNEGRLEIKEAPKKQQAMQQKPGNMFHPLSSPETLEHQIMQHMGAIEHNLRSKIIGLSKEVEEIKNMKNAGVNKKDFMKIVEDFLIPGIRVEINDKLGNKLTAFNAKINQLYELLGLGNYDKKKKNIMETNLLALKKDIMRISLFKILFNINEKEMGCLTKKIKEKIGKGKK